MSARTMPDYAGLRYYARARTTGTHVGVYDGEEADGGRWQTVCEEHGSVISHETLELARQHAPHPEEWREFCNGSRTEEKP
jgi:hypothetical protein